MTGDAVFREHGRLRQGDSAATGPACAKATVLLKPDTTGKQLAAMTAAPQSATEMVVPGGFGISRTPLPMGLRNRKTIQVG